MKVPSPELSYDCTISTRSASKFDLDFEKGQYPHPADEISIILGVAGRIGIKPVLEFRI